jgi:hypothetical protein
MCAPQGLIPRTGVTGPSGRSLDTLSVNPELSKHLDRHTGEAGGETCGFDPFDIQRAEREAVRFDAFVDWECPVVTILFKDGIPAAAGSIT